MENSKKRKNLFIITNFINQFLKDEFIGQHSNAYNTFLFHSYDQCFAARGVVPDIITLDHINNEAICAPLILKLKSVWSQAEIICISSSDDRLDARKLLSLNNKTDIYHTLEIACKTSNHIYIQ
jgi:hypothetical protein